MLPRSSCFWNTSTADEAGHEMRLLGSWRHQQPHLLLMSGKSFAQAQTVAAWRAAAVAAAAVAAAAVAAAAAAAALSARYAYTYKINSAIGIVQSSSAGERKFSTTCVLGPLCSIVKRLGNDRRIEGKKTRRRRVDDVPANRPFPPHTSTSPHSWPSLL